MDFGWISVRIHPKAIPNPSQCIPNLSNSIQNQPKSIQIHPTPIQIHLKSVNIICDLGPESLPKRWTTVPLLACPMRGYSSRQHSASSPIPRHLFDKGAEAFLGPVLSCLVYSHKGAAPPHGGQPQSWHKFVPRRPRRRSAHISPRFSSPHHCNIILTS